LFGSLAAGYLSDGYGRKSAFMISTIAYFISSASLACVSALYPLLICRFMAGFSCFLLLPIVITIASEITPYDSRGKVLVILTGFSGLGMIYTCAICIFAFDTPETGNWRLLFLLAALPIGIIPLGALFCLKESPRYAIFKNYEEAVKILEAMHQVNHKTPLQFAADDEGKLKEWLCEQNAETNEMTSEFKELFRGPNARITVLVWIIWFVIYFASYGVVFALPITLAQASNNTTLDFTQALMTGVAQSAATILCYVMIEDVDFGRKNSLAYFFFVAAIASIMAFFTRNLIFCAFILLVNFALMPLFSFVYPLTSELYHTKIRSTGLGYAGAAGGLGGVASPFFVLQLATVSVYLPYLVFGLCFLFGGIITLFLPYDTTNRELDVLEPEKKEKNYKAV